jgi:drug/metabolite transporter (DMT)-like permease
MKPSARPAAPPLLVLAFGVLAVSTASIFIRYAQEHAHSLVIAAWRLSLAALILAPAAVTRRTELTGLTRREAALALLSGVFLAIHFATWISSLAYTSVASAVVLVDTAPLWVALLAPLALRETISRPVKVGMALAMLGGAVVGLSDACTWSPAGLVCPPLAEFVRGRAFFGDLLALAGAIAAAVYLVIGRRVRERVSLLSYIFVVYGTAAVVLVAVMLLSGQPATGFPPLTYVWFLALAIFPQLLGHSSYNWALGYLPAAYVSLALLGEPIGSTLLAVVFLGEIPSGLRIAGAALTLAGIYIASRSTV